MDGLDLLFDEEYEKTHAVVSVDPDTGVVDLNSISITDFINKEYRDYSLYTVFDRALPGIDGLKPTQRKILFTADKINDMKKTAALAGDVISVANYHHGNTSLETGIVTLSRTDNNVPIMDGKGYYGNRVVPKPSAARYTKSVISKAFKKYFLDSDIAPPSIDPDNPEPDYYLPLVPWVLINGATGIAVGFASLILPRDPELIRKACMAHLLGRDISQIQYPPHFNKFRGEVKKSPNGWHTYGIINHNRANLYNITELPCGKLGQDRITFVKTLNMLVAMDAIISYKDRCCKTGFNFELKLRHKIPPMATIKAKLRNEIRTRFQDTNTKFTQEKLEKAVETAYTKRVKFITPFIIAGRKPAEIVEELQNSKELKMVLNNTDNLTCIDENEEVKIYDSVPHLIKYYVDFRLKQYARRYDAWIKRDTEKLKMAKIKSGFIKAVIAEKINLKGMKRADSLLLLTNNGIELEVAEILLRMPVYSFCPDELEKLAADITKYTSLIDQWKTTDHKEAYLSELKALA